MADQLGILVTSDKHMAHLMSLTTAANARSKKVLIFFTGSGVYLTQDPLFKKLAAIAEVSVCETSFRNFGLSKTVCGPGFKNFVSPSKNAELIITCDRYLTF